MNFPAGFKKIMNSTVVLYLVYFIAGLNVLGYVSVNDYNSLAVFTLTAYLATYFSKNNMIVLLSAVLLTNVLGNTQVMVVEGMETVGDDDDDDDDEDDDDDDDTDDDDDDDTDDEDDNALSFTGKGPSKNVRESMEQQYNNLDNLMGKGGIEAMTKDTNKLIKRQEGLKKTMESMGPLLNNAKSLLDGFDPEQLQGIQNTLKDLKKNN